MREAIDAGLSIVTHLGNGCPMQVHRHDNIVQRVLSLSDRLWISFIAVGAHVYFPHIKEHAGMLLVASDKAWQAPPPASATQLELSMAV